MYALGRFVANKMEMSVKVKHFMSRTRTFGDDGLLTLLLSNVVLLLTAGLTLGWSLLYVIRVARTAETTASRDSVLLVMGLRLEKNDISRDYNKRLDRAVNLYNAARIRNRYHNILVVGGLTGGQVSEASLGRDCLIRQGIPMEHIDIEDASVHTLENLRNARAIMKSKGFEKITIITSRYHLARSMIIAEGLGMHPLLCGAEGSFSFMIRQIPRLLLEGYYIHWYYTGAMWSRITRNRKSLGRIH